MANGKRKSDNVAEEIKIPAFAIQVPAEAAEDFAAEMMREAIPAQSLAVSIIVKYYRQKRRAAVLKHLRDYGFQGSAIPSFGQETDPTSSEDEGQPRA